MSELLYKDECHPLAVEKLAEAHSKQLLNCLAIARLQPGVLVNFGSASREWKRVVL